MLDFPNSYFKDEIRSDFNVPEMMKRCWAAHLKILEELQALFAKYGLIYYADFGTLLGAVRHQGIIPWDDDVDISMPRADFMKLVEHADEIGGGLTIRSVYNTETFVNFHAVATHKVDTLKWDDERMQEYYGCPFICYIDIFPMDYIPRDPDKKKLMKQLYSYTYKLVHTCVEVEQEYNVGALITRNDLPQLLDRGDSDGKLQDFIHQLKDLEDYLHRFYNGTITLDGQKSLRNQLALAAEAIASSCPESEADRVDYCPHMAYLTGDISRKKEWVESTKLMPFENTQIAVPTMYHEVLVSRFGEDYMTPVHAASTHEYPYYRTQVEVLIGGDTGELCHENRNKKAFLEALGTFDEAHEILGKCLDDYKKTGGVAPESADTIRGLVADLQDGAVGIGEAIEELKGEGTNTVKKLENYCEELYTLYRTTEENQEEHQLESAHEMEGLDRLLKDIRRSIIREIHDDVPSEWESKLHRPDGSHRKVMIYGFSAIEILSHGLPAPGKMLRSLEIFKESGSDICIMLVLPEGLPDFMDKCKLELADAYRDAVSSFAKEDLCICPDASKLDLVISLADAYYGDECPLMNRCKEAGMPIMIQNYEL